MLTQPDIVNLTFTTNQTLYFIRIKDTGEDVSPEFFMSYSAGGSWVASPFTYSASVDNYQYYSMSKTTYPDLVRIGFRLTFINHPYTSTPIQSRLVSQFVTVFNDDLYSDNK